MDSHMQSQHPSFTKGVLKNIKNKIYIWALNKFIAKKDEHYGFIEPTIEWMNIHNKKFWIQPCIECVDDDDEVMK